MIAGRAMDAAGRRLNDTNPGRRPGAARATAGTKAAATATMEYGHG
jgi:hypothetical protein